MSIFTGCGVALATPFFENGDVDFDVLGEMIDYYVEADVDALIICGTTGEASTLTDREQVDVIEYAVKRNHGRKPLIAGAGSNDTRHGVNLSKMCEDAGADALLQVTPYYNKTSQTGLLKHFEALDKAISIPMIAYTVPGRTGMPILPETVQKIAEMDSFVALKDATGDLSYTCKVASLVDENFDLYSGNDDVVLPVLSLGGKGVISVWANVFPREVKEMCDAYFSGDLLRAQKIQLRFKAFIDALFRETSPIPLKYALTRQGWKSQHLRMPLWEASDGTKEVMDRVMEELE